MKTAIKASAGVATLMLFVAANAHADQQILDDLIVDGSICVGFDCVNGESFGFDTLRLKENNTRIKFLDTSTSASFPSNDWQITANDSSNGGQNKFSIDDISGGRTPFTIEASAPSHSLYVDDGGRVGFGTAIPVANLHVKAGNTPTLRLEQDGSSGFTPQTWDVAGNEANFFIRDATNGSKLAFRIRPGAPSSSIDIAADGSVGIGTSSPKEDLDIRDAGPARIGLTNTQAAEDSESHQEWVLDSDGGFRINGGGDAAEFNLQGDGDLIITGVLIHNSDRHAKDNIEPVNAREVLKKVVELPLSKWNFKTDAHDKHLGPMAQDFYAAFDLGKDETKIASLDTSGVALAAIQGLYQLIMEKESEIAKLRAELSALKEAKE